MIKKLSYSQLIPIQSFCIKYNIIFQFLNDRVLEFYFENSSFCIIIISYTQNLYTLDILSSRDDSHN